MNKIMNKMKNVNSISFKILWCNYVYFNYSTIGCSVTLSRKSLLLWVFNLIRIIKLKSRRRPLRSRRRCVVGSHNKIALWRKKSVKTSRRFKLYSRKLGLCRNQDRVLLTTRNCRRWENKFRLKVTELKNWGFGLRLLSKKQELKWCRR